LRPQVRAEDRHLRYGRDFLPKRISTTATAFPRSEWQEMGHKPPVGFQYRDVEKPPFRKRPHFSLTKFG